MKFKKIELKKDSLPDRYKTHKFEKGRSHKEPIFKRFEINIDSRIEDILEPAGRLLSWSKSVYSREHPDNEIRFNACIFNEEGVELWFGDIDLTLETNKLQQVADTVGVIYVTPETPYRFEGLSKQNKENLDVIKFLPTND